MERLPTAVLALLASSSTPNGTCIAAWDSLSQRWEDHATLSLAQSLETMALSVLAAVLGIGALSLSRWILWLGLSFGLAACQLAFAGYQMFGIALSLAVLFALKGAFTLYRLWRFVSCYRPRRKVLLDRLRSVRNAQDFQDLAEALAEEQGEADWRRRDDAVATAELMRAAAQQLRAAREARDLRQLEYLLGGICKRNYLNFESEDHFRPEGAHEAVETMLGEVVEAIRAVAMASATPRRQRLRFLRKLQRSLGRTALCLSGGGAIAMYHMGVVRGLIETGVYQQIRVISGTSGGSIVAAMLASRTEQELLETVCVEDVVSDFGRDGRMEREKVRWFPPFHTQILNFARFGVLVDNREFQRTCDLYWGDMTFAEGYARTRKHVSITVSSSVLGTAAGAKGTRLLCNHITTPHVLLRSAVAASCSLPGIMLPNKLEAKHGSGEIVTFDLDGVEWIDGSVQADVPFKEQAALFGVTNHIVSQVNFHVLPFIRKSHSPQAESSYWRFCRYLEMDIRYRATALSHMGLFPRFFGQDVGKVFKQKYHGDVTLVPEMRAADMLGLKALLNPTTADMRKYINGGRLAALPSLPRIRAMLCMEAGLSRAIDQLRRDPEAQAVRWHEAAAVETPDDLDSDTEPESTVHTAGHRRRSLRYHRTLVGGALLTRRAPTRSEQSAMRQRTASLDANFWRDPAEPQTSLPESSAALAEQDVTTTDDDPSGAPHDAGALAGLPVSAPTTCNHGPCEAALAAEVVTLREQNARLARELQAMGRLLENAGLKDGASSAERVAG